MIPLLSAEEAKRRAREAGVGEDFARLNVFRMLLQNPTVAHAAAGLLGTLMNKNSIEARTRELIILRTAWRTGSEYEFCRHMLRSRKLAMSEQEILGVRDPVNCAAYSEVDRAVINMADELSDRAQVARETMAMLERAFTPAQIVELVIAAGNWRMFAALFNTAELPLDDDIAAGWPEGKRPPR
ncbi:MAG: carboxymuconolactone decarboxylase family protein [Candidatus Binataceae bacterium]